jgi:hypothetical protein
MRAENGVAAIEFALVLPLLVVMFMGTVELSRYYLIFKRVSNTAASMVQILSTSEKMRPETELNFIASSLYVIPTIESDTKAAGGGMWGAHNVSIASVEFVSKVKGCTHANCKFDALVRYTYSVDPELKRPCGTLRQESNASRLDRNSLPSSIYGAGGTLVVDISYSFKPLFGSRFFKERTMFVSSFMAPRYLPVVPFGPAKPPVLQICS